MMHTLSLGCGVSRIGNTALAYGASVRPTFDGASRQIPENHFNMPLLWK